MVLVSGGGGEGQGATGGSSGGRSTGTAASAMDKAWGVTVAPPQQHKQRHDPCPWHKHDVAEKERAKHLQRKSTNKTTITNLNLNNFVKNLKFMIKIFKGLIKINLYFYTNS